MTEKERLAQAATYLKTDDFDDAETLALAVLSEMSGNALRAEAYRIIGTAYLRRGQWQKALQFLDIAQSYVAESDDRSHVQTAILLNVGAAYYGLGNFSKALESYTSAHAIYEDNGTEEGIAQSAGNMAAAFRSMGDYEKALECYKRSVAIFERLGMRGDAARVTGNMGNAYDSLGDYAMALECFNRALAVHEEFGDKSNIASTTNNIGGLYSAMGEFEKALEYSGRSLLVSTELGYELEIALAESNIGSTYSRMGDYAQSLEYHGRALARHESMGNRSSYALTLGSIGNIHLHLEDYDKAMENYIQALAIFEEIGNKPQLALVLENISSVQRSLGNYAKGMEYLQRSLAIYEEMGEQLGIASVSSNMGIFHYLNGDYQASLESLEQSLAAQETIGEMDGVAIVIGNIGMLLGTKEFAGYNPERAEQCFLRAIALNEQIGSKKNLYENHCRLAELYEQLERWKEHSFHYKRYHELEREVQSEDAKRLAERMDAERKNAARDKQIAVERAKHEATEKLLHNVLPQSITKRLLENEKPIADKAESVSVFFSDVVGFTTLSQKISAKELVTGLNDLFIEFDVLAKKHNIEKIKTIGDAYMAVCGAPDAREDHAQQTCAFALAIQRLFDDGVSIAGHKISIRIGLHCGEVVAGVIGENKFAYDLWGDAVNTASRMESHGEAGKIHCSEAFARELGMTNEELGMEEGDAQLVIRNSQFVISSRGEMEIKGKGKMRTYFLEKAE